MRNRFPLLLTLMLLLLTTAPSLLAQTSTWQLPGGGDWTVASNWDTPPSLGDNVVFNNVDGTITNIPTGFFVNNFTKSGTGTVTLASDLQIRGNLVVSGGGFVGASGTVITFNGNSVTQTIGGSGNITFHRLVVDKLGSADTTTPSFSNPKYEIVNPLLCQTSITVNDTLAVRRGIFSFSGQDNQTSSHTVGFLRLGSSTSQVTYTTQIISNTGIVLNNHNNCIISVTVENDFIADAGKSYTLGLATPRARSGTGPNDGKVIFTIKRHFNVPDNDTLVFGANGWLNLTPPPPGPHQLDSIIMNIGQIGVPHTGNFIIANENSAYLGNVSGGTNPIINLNGGTVATPATHRIHFNVFEVGFANASAITNINGVYEVPAGIPNLAIVVANVPARRLRINGWLIMNDGTQIRGANIGSGGTRPRLEMGDTARLIIRHLNGLGRGDAAPGCIVIGASPEPWILTALATAGTIVQETNVNNIMTVTGLDDSLAYNRLIIRHTNSTAGILTPSITNPVRFDSEFKADTLIIEQGIVTLTNGSSPTTRIDSVNVIEIGSSTSSFGPSTYNTGLILSNHSNNNVTLRVAGDFYSSASASSPVGVTLAYGGFISGGSAALTVNGKFETRGSSSIRLGGNATIGGVPTTFNFNGDVSLSSTSRINLDRPGTSPSTVNLGGSPMSWSVQPVSLLGLTGETNMRGNWNVPSGASVSMPSNSAIAVMNGFSLAVNGTLECANGSELISTWTAPTPPAPSQVSTLTLGANGIIRVADVDGLGDGTLLNPPSNFPLFICRTSSPSPDPNTWLLSSINTAGTIEYNGTGQTVTPRNTSLSNNYFNLVFSGGNKTLGGNVDATNSLTLNGGIITTGTNDLTLTNSSATSLTRTAGHINGRLVRAIGTTSADYLYPIGDASTYRQITLTSNASTSASFLRGEVISGNANSFSVNPPLANVSFLRYYQFTNTGTNTIDVTELKNVQVSGDDGIGSLNPNTSLRLSSRISGPWAERALTAAPNTTSLPIQISSTAFTAETIASGGGTYFVSLATTNSGDNPLPVELLSFTATSTAQGVRLAWETASEHESRGFTLLRKKEGESAWTEVASYQTDNTLRSLNALNGASYSFTDKALLEVGKSYDYQLRETGFDGQVATLETVTLTIRFNVAREYELAQNYPNPFNPATMIRYQIPTAEVVSLKVYDVLGKEVATLVSGRQEAGSYVVPFNASGLSSGMYFYRLQAGSFVETRKMMLVK